MIFVDEKIVELLRENYPRGTRVVLKKMDDKQAPPIGTKGTVRGVDDTGSIVVEWDNGSCLSVIYGEDECVKEGGKINVLEKILEEVDKKADYYESDEQGREHIRMVDMVEVEEIIRSHMNSIQEDGMLTSYDDTYDVIIHCSNKEDQTIELIKNFNWIPVSERLPEVPEGTEDDDCPEFNVTIKGADKATTLKYAPDGTWFDDSGEVYKVVAWKSLPEPYKGE